MSMDRDDREYLAAGYVLGGLSDDDLAAASHLLETDSSFRNAVAEYEDSLAGMAEADEPLAVSAETTAAILAIPREERTHSAKTHSAADAASQDPAPTKLSPMTSSPAEPISLDALRASRRTWRVLAGAAAAAVVVAVAGLGGALLHVTGEQRELDESLAQSQEQLDQAERLLTASDVRSDTVEMGEGADLTVVWSVSEQVFQVRHHGVTVPDDRDMQLWLIDDTGAHSVGFVADGPVTVDGSEFADGALIGVTDEPAGGSPQPTSDPLAVVEL